MKKLNKKGFTLIELLAVIIILGVLMIIAIPAVTKYINDSRKSAYVDSAVHYSDAVMKEAIAGKDLKMYETDALYLIAVGHKKDESCVTLESGGKSPYSDDWNYAYVGVTYSENGYSYYFISEDGSGQGLPMLTNKDLVDEGTEHFYSSNTDEGATAAALATAIKGKYDLNANYIATSEEDLTTFAALKTFAQTKSGNTITKIIFINKPASGNCHYEKANS